MKKRKVSISDMLDEEKIRNLRYQKAATDSDRLAELCEEYHLDHSNFLPKSNLPMQDRLAQLLHEYRAVVSSIPAPAAGDHEKANLALAEYAKEHFGFASPSVCETVHAIYVGMTAADPKAKEKQLPTAHPAYSLEYNLILAFLYVALRNSGNCVFLVDLIEAAANNTLPYFTGYNRYLQTSKPLAKPYTLIPTNLPTTQWLRKVINRMVKNGDCQLSPFPARKCFDKAQEELQLPEKLVELAIYLYSKAQRAVAKQRLSKVEDECLVLGAIVFSAKLLYGLDDKPYVKGIDPILAGMMPEDVYAKMQTAKETAKRRDRSGLGKVTAGLPSLYEFMKRTRLAMMRKRTAMPWKVSELHSMTGEQVNSYLDYCEKVVFQDQNLERTSDCAHTFAELAGIFGELRLESAETASSNMVPVGSGTAASSVGPVNEYVMEELEFVENAQKLADEDGKKVVYPQASECYVKYKCVFSDLAQDPISYEYQHLLITFGRYVSEPVNQLIRAVRIYEDVLC